jgi:SAM-dependent methyltransferase
LIPDLDHTFDLIYCKRVLFNFRFDGGNDDGADRIRWAIKNMVRTLKSGGWLCLVEVDGWPNPTDLEDSLSDNGLAFEKPRQVIRPYNSPLGVRPTRYNVHHCIKQ